MRVLISMILSGVAILVVAGVFLYQNAGRVQLKGSSAEETPAASTGEAVNEEARQKTRSSTVKARSRPASAGSGPASAPVKLPRPVAGVNFGMPPQAVEQSFPIAWRREGKNSLMFVHYPQGSGGPQIRFEFQAGGLMKIKVHHRLPAGQTLASFYDHIRRQCASRFEGNPESRHSSWSNGRLTARVNRGTHFVEVVYSPGR